MLQNHVGHVMAHLITRMAHNYNSDLNYGCKLMATCIRHKEIGRYLLRMETIVSLLLGFFTLVFQARDLPKSIWR